MKGTVTEDDTVLLVDDVIETGTRLNSAIDLMDRISNVAGAVVIKRNGFEEDEINEGDTPLVYLVD